MAMLEAVSFTDGSVNILISYKCVSWWQGIDSLNYEVICRLIVYDMYRSSAMVEYSAIVVPLDAAAEELISNALDSYNTDVVMQVADAIAISMNSANCTSYATSECESEFNRLACFFTTNTCGGNGWIPR